MEGVLSQFSFIYAATTALKRKSLWSDLLHLRQNTSVPWMVIGDFNAVLGAHECLGGQPPIRSSCEDFRSVTELCDFSHMDTSGAFFTWARGHGRSHIERRLDRALSNRNFIGGPKPFKFQSMWLLHPSFQDLVANYWRTTTPAGCPMYVTLQKLTALKLCLKHWNYSVFGNLKSRPAKTAMLDATRRQEAFWRDRAKVKWLTDGDKCTSFFHAYARNKTARASINCLHDGHSLLTDLEDISNHVVTFYQSLYGPDVVAFVQYFFQHNWLYPNANSNFIVLLPKVEGANLISQFRPIALVYFLFKIIPKILADRLGPIASRIISPNQSAFLPGRRISDCIGLVSEGFNLLDRKTRGGNVGIKVDIAKAFDTLNWQFLFQVLHQFGFSPDFMNYVNTILNSARLSVMINGSPKGYFPCARGARQGDPLSPLLFCIAEEALSR
ncbi:uncharacterized protein LOC112194671 [Rosa chinensis]|uniref:uncharacterized protein LOC112194671 n=1 Tax=Rosa chinensis TaxID=74649 RepID=UPI000D094889|nr:uncharacterized protein LOC112194671 [Rosa chinensis]